MQQGGNVKTPEKVEYTEEVYQQWVAGVNKRAKRLQCKTCGANRGEPCLTASGHPVSARVRFHADRFKRAAAKYPAPWV